VKTPLASGCGNALESSDGKWQDTETTLSNRKTRTTSALGRDNIPDHLLILAQTCLVLTNFVVSANSTPPIVKYDTNISDWSPVRKDL